MKNEMNFRTAFWGHGAPFGFVFFVLIVCILLVTASNSQQFFEPEGDFTKYLYIANEINYQFILVCSSLVSFIICLMITFWKMKIRPILGVEDYLLP